MNWWITVLVLVFVAFGMVSYIRSRGFETSYAVDNTIISLYEEGILTIDAIAKTISIHVPSNRSLSSLEKRIIERGFRDKDTVLLKKFRSNALTNYKQYHQAMDQTAKVDRKTVGIPALRIRTLTENHKEAYLLFDIVFTSDSMSTS